MNPLTSVVAAAQQGDKEAFNQLVVRFQDMAYASAYAILGDAHLAQDAAQEAFLDAYQNLAKLRDPATFPGWFRRIVFGRSHRQIRAYPQGLVSLDELPEIEAGLGDPIARVHERETSAEVQAAIAALSPNHRMAVALYYIEGYSQHEIAAYLETPLSTVKKRLYDARQQLKERMIQMMQEQLQANRPSQNDEFARRVSFFTAILAGDTRQTEQLLAQDPSLLTTKVEWKMALKSGYWPLGSSALHLAVGRADQAMAEMLLNHGAPLEATNVGEITPLHLAAIMQRAAMAKLLLAHGANVNARTKIDQSALHHAALRGDQATLRVLLEHKVNVNERDREGHTAADLAALRGDRKIVEMLVAQGASQPSVRTQRPAWPRPPANTALLTTGIKAIDLLAPLPRGGIAGHFTPLAGVGFSVLLAQYIMSLAEIYDGAAIYAGLESYEGYAESMQIGWHEVGINDRVTYLFGKTENGAEQRIKLVERGMAAAKAHQEAGRETLLLIDSNLAATDGILPYIQKNTARTAANAAITTIVHGHHTVGVLPDALSNLTTVVTFSGMLARLRLYPAVDPVRSASQLLDGPLAGSTHAQIATQARHLLQRYMDVQPVVEAGGIEALWYINDDPQLQQTVARGRRLQRFLTQPFYGAEPWTGLLGQLVPLEETLKGCAAILKGEYDSLPEDAFQYVGTIEEAVTKGKTNR